MNTRYEAARRLRAVLDAGRQATRLLRLSFPHDDGPEDALFVANRLEADEGLSCDFVFNVEVLSDSPSIPLEDLMGKLVTLALSRVDGSTRYFSGHVFDARFVRNDAGFAFYAMVLRPRLAFLQYRRDNYLFHGQTVEQQTDSILRDHEIRDWHLGHRGVDERMTEACQWDESDYNYLHRRWEARGWHYRYEHRADGHKLMLSGDSRTSPPIDGSGEIEWQGTSGLRGVGITQWSRVRSVASTHYTASSFDFKSPRPRTFDQPTLNKQGKLPPLEVYDYAGAYAFERGVTGADLTRRRIEAIEAAALHFEGRGDDDHAQAGRRFALRGHVDLPRLRKKEEDNDFLVLEVKHSISNNFELRDGGVPVYANTLRCIPTKTPWRPMRGFNSSAPRLYGLQTAIVVGPPGDKIHTDSYGRVRVQFHWDREGASDEHSSAWVRVASGWAGSEYGQLALPRIGQEVIVQWLDGNPDRPLITGRVYNRDQMPPWQLPGQEALTGFRSRELAAGWRGNHLVLDDSPGKIQAQLRSDHQASQLSLGHICRIEDEAGRKDMRGQGFELRTDGHGALRAQQGLLISTEARPKARAHITDMSETLQGLQEGQALHRSLSTAAQQAQAQQAGDQDKVVESIEAQLDELKGRGGAPEQGHFPEFQQPHLSLASPAGIQTQTRGSTHMASAEHHALSSGGHTSISAGKSLLVSVKEAVRLFACQAGMKLVAAGADIDISALKNSINLLAKLDITQTANRITISAKEEVVINGGGSYTRWNAGGIAGGTNGVWRMKAGSHKQEGPDNAPPPELPEPVTLEELEQKRSLAVTLSSHAVGGRPLADEPYELYKGGALAAKGITDAIGQLIIKDHVPGTPAYTVELSNGARFELKVSKKLDAGNPGQRRSNQGFRGPKGDQGRADDYGDNDDFSE